ncbi:MAG: hypothetical protein A3E79_08695 [Burkholderiales bacterium RIFCSPHIGHO2_12_FULL_61_11]|nr:MAG: hypothetical protein A3E79_08695 [Burkholderiales bacterium RIFCSPHIGHO2_12_FULL_61_11]
MSDLLLLFDGGAPKAIDLPLRYTNALECCFARLSVFVQARCDEHTRNSANVAGQACQPASDPTGPCPDSEPKKHKKASSEPILELKPRAVGPDARGIARGNPALAKDS